jgi:hypothetical protein
VVFSEPGEGIFNNPAGVLNAIFPDSYRKMSSQARLVTAPRRPGHGPGRHRAGAGDVQDHPAELARAFCYNLLELPVAALGFFNPLVAAAAVTLSSVFAV